LLFFNRQYIFVIEQPVDGYSNIILGSGNMEMDKNLTDLLINFVSKFDSRAPFSVMGVLYSGWRHGGPAPTQGLIM